MYNSVIKEVSWNIEVFLQNSGFIYWEGEGKLNEVKGTKSLKSS